MGGMAKFVSATFMTITQAGAIKRMPPGKKEKYAAGSPAVRIAKAPNSW